MRHPTRRTILAACLPATALALVTLAAGTPLAAQTPAENDSAAAAAAAEKGLPLIGTRSLEFTTSEGTWLSLDLSPDGETLVFDLLGDLYTLPIRGGRATRITEGQAYDMQPRFSPDGSELVFVSDRNGSENLWIAGADGSDPRPLTTGERESYVSPVWTPEGDYVMASKGGQLWMWHEDGGSGVQVTGNGEDGASSSTFYGPAFDADPDRVWVNVRGLPSGGLAAGSIDDRAVAVGSDAPAFGPRHHPDGTVTTGPRSSRREVGDFQIGQLDRTTGEVRVRTHEMEGAFRPMPSPDGRWLVYATRWDEREALKLLDVETGEERWLAMDVQRDEHQGGGTRDRDVYPGSAWTPDSRALLTAFDGKIWRIDVPSGERTEIPFTAEVNLEMGPLVQFDYRVNDSTLTVNQIRGARPSPDGGRLAFTALDRLYVSGAEGDVVSDARRLTDARDVEHAPAWSPDGRWIAYVTWNDADGGAIWRIPSNGSGEPERLTSDGAFYDRIAWTRDGTRLLAVRGSKLHRMRTLEDFGSHGSAAELEYVQLPADPEEDGEPERIAWVGTGATQQGRNAPHVGPDPERVYVWSGSDGLLSMRLDGTDVRTHVKVSLPSRNGGGGTPDEVVLSPDGRRAVVRANRNVWLITVPRVGGEAPTVSLSGSSSMPVRRLTRVGGDFVGWSEDGAEAFWSIGRSFFRWNVAEADAAIADSVAAARSEADDPDEEPDEDPEEEEDEEGSPAYEPTRLDVEINVPKDRPRGTVALTGARLITMRGDEVIESGDIVITDNRIAEIGPTGSVAIPDDATVMDMSGRTIMPGLVDIHAHTWVAWGVHRTQVSQFLAQLAYGVTTQRDPQTSSEDVVTYSDRVETGDILGPRIYSTGPGVFGSDDIGSLDDARDVLRRYSDHHNTRTIKQYMAGDRKVRQWIIMAARELELTPTTEGGSNLTMNLTLMQDGYAGLEHSLPVSPLYDDVVELHRESGMTYTPTFIVAYGGPSGREYYLTRTNVDTVPRLRRFTPHDELDKWQDVRWYREDQYVHPLHAEQLVKMVEAGGRVGLGSHGEIQGLGTHWELWMMASGGMDPHDALRAATIHGADAIGLDGDLGSLEPGKLADLQVLDQNPLDDIHNTTAIRYVMKNGRLYEADTLDEVWPRERALPTQWWWQVEPDGEAPPER